MSRHFPYFTDDSSGPSWARSRNRFLDDFNANKDTMTAEQISAMPVREIAAKNSVLFLWATNPLMPEAFEVMKAWGWKYKTLLTWEKTNGTGMGYWFRGVTEHLLLGVRGDVQAFRSPIKNLVRCNVGRHSAKPQQVHDIIESVTQGMNRVELFARLHRPGWTAWGNQVERDLYSPNEKAHRQETRRQ